MVNFRFHFTQRIHQFRRWPILIPGLYSDHRVFTHHLHLNLNSNRFVFISNFVTTIYPLWFHNRHYRVVIFHNCFGHFHLYFL
ncbi:hypothetical protein HanRHA438_Chr06g0256661 [Helianthus annuus]|nr:hypothetical protein HanRHA438_Chr06g0256661 [Helianthus annuus]